MLRRATHELSVLVLYKDKKPTQTFRLGSDFLGAVWHNLYEPVLKETTVLYAVSIFFSVFVTCFFDSFKCSGLSVKL